MPDRVGVNARAGGDRSRASHERREKSTLAAGDCQYAAGIGFLRDFQRRPGEPGLQIGLFRRLICTACEQGSAAFGQGAGDMQGLGHFGRETLAKT